MSRAADSWRGTGAPLNSPVFDPEGQILYIIHSVEDVTEFVQLKNLRVEQNKLAEKLQLRTGQMESEIYLRAEELENVESPVGSCKPRIGAAL